jgi:hypothetical protein
VLVAEGLGRKDHRLRDKIPQREPLSRSLRANRTACGSARRQPPAAAPAIAFNLTPPLVAQSSWRQGDHARRRWWASALPRTQLSRRARRTGCIARMIGKPIPREADLSRRAAAFVGRRAAGSPRTQSSGAGRSGRAQTAVLHFSRMTEATGGHNRLACWEFMLVFVARGRGRSVPLSGQAFDVDGDSGAAAGTSVRCDRPRTRPSDRCRCSLVVRSGLLDHPFFTADVTSGLERRTWATVGFGARDRRTLREDLGADRLCEGRGGKVMRIEDLPEVQ